MRPGRRRLAHALGLDHEPPVGDDAARERLISDRTRQGKAFAGHRRLIDIGVAGHHRAVDRNGLAGADNDALAAFKLHERHTRKFAVVAFHPDVARRLSQERTQQFVRLLDGRGLDMLRQREKEAGHAGGDIFLARRRHADGERIKNVGLQLAARRRKDAAREDAGDVEPSDRCGERRGKEERGGDRAGRESHAPGVGGWRRSPGIRGR